VDRRPRGAIAMMAIAVSLLAGCTVFQKQIETSQRFERFDTGKVTCDASVVPVSGAGDAPDRHAEFCFQADVSALGTGSSDAPLAVTGLSDRGQGAYISGLASTSKDASELRAAVGAPIKAAGSPVAAFQDSSTLKLRFVLGLFPVTGYLNPGDRLAWAKVTITPDWPCGSDARFTAWTQAANAFETIDVGSVTASRTEKLTAETGIDAAKFLTDTKAGAEISATREEKADIKDRVGIFASIKGGSARIVQYGGWRRDLAGNSTFDASVTLSPADTEMLTFTTSGDLKVKNPAAGATPWIAPDKVMLGQRFVRVQKPAPLCARVSLDFVVRHIVKGSRSFTESNDDVVFYRGATDSVEDVSPPVIPEKWRIVAPRTVRGRPAPLQLSFKGDDGQEQILTFSDKGQAIEFLSWLRASKTRGRVGNGQLYLRDGEPLDTARYPGLDAVYIDAQSDWAAATTSCSTRLENGRRP